MSEARHHRVRLVALGGAALAAAVGAIVWWDRRDTGDPWDPDAPRYPADEERRVTTADGVELAVSVAGPSDGPTVLLSHCWTGSRAIWGPVAERLVASGHRVAMYDQRGHGDSTYGDDPPTVAMLGDDLRSVIDALELDDVVLAGHSMGGMSIQSYAAEHPTHFKEHVTGVVLVSTAARVLGRTINPALVDRLIGDRYPAWAGRGIPGRAFVRGSIGRAPQRAHVELTLDGWVRTSGYARAGFLTAMGAMDLEGALQDHSIPVTVMVGTRDTLTPIRLARRLAGGINGAKLEVLPGAGHMLPLEAAEAVVEEIEAVRAS